MKLYFHISTVVVILGLCAVTTMTETHYSICIGKYWFGITVPHKA